MLLYIVGCDAPPPTHTHYHVLHCNQSVGDYLCHMIISHFRGSTTRAVLGWRPGALGQVTTYAANCALGSCAVNQL